VANQDVSAFMQLHGTPFSASQPFFPATTTLGALAQPRVVDVDAQVNFNHEANIASNPIPDSALEVFENRHSSAEIGPTGTNAVFWAQDDYDFLANYGRKVDIS
jgi:hypothetical protein